MPASMMKGCGTFILLISLIAVAVSRSSVIYNRPYSRFVKRDVDSSQTSSKVHNVTMDCGDFGERFRTMSQCVHDLVQLALQGYPWSTAYVNMPNFTAPMPRIPSLHGKLGFLTLLEMSAPGTALDTVWGKALLAYLQTLSVEELCTTWPAYQAYTACVMSSDGKSEITKFNILQFAHGIIPSVFFPYHGSHCNGLERFTACWNLLQEICGPKVQGLEQYATLLVEGCKIQSEMDLAGCHWQDMLLPHYIQASQVTAWPIAAQCLRDPMMLETTYHYMNITNDLGRVISLLQPGVEDISRICGQHLATRVQSVLDKVRYFLYDAYKYDVLLTEANPP